MDIPDRLIELQQTADDERAELTGLDGDEHAAQWPRWRDAAVKIQAAVTEHAQEAGLNRAALEAEVKKAVRHPAPVDG
ncbi:hypothetical protein [Streptomyces sp. NPDC019937]|uniref:hypothetical protein n=1 Tax=Streptomyces sp. NPDC019937 TaxID=3154787 RepID=UPI003409E6F2